MKPMQQHQSHRRLVKVCPSRKE